MAKLFVAVVTTPFQMSPCIPPTGSPPPPPVRLPHASVHQVTGEH